MRIRGTVKWFNDTKGYGFLRRDDGQSDCFVHHSDIQSEGYRSLQEGERVEFDVIEQPKGPKASNVVKVSELGGADAQDDTQDVAQDVAQDETQHEPEAAPAEPTEPPADTGFDGSLGADSEE